MKSSISSLVSALDPYQPSSFAVGLDMGVSWADTMADMENVPWPIWKMSVIISYLINVCDIVVKSSRNHVLES